MRSDNLPPDVAWMALDHTSDIVLCLGEAGEIVSANEAAYLRLGYNPGELTGVSIRHISPDFIVLPGSDGLSINGPCNFQSNMITNNDDPDIPVEVSLVSLVRGQQIIYWVFARDISLRILTVEALRQSELKFRGAFHDASVGMAIFSLDGYFSDVNPFLCDTLGYSVEEFRELHFLDITHPDDIESSRMHDRMIRQGKIPFGYHEKRYLRKDDTPVWFIASDSMIHDESGHGQYVLTHYQNITKRKEVEQALRASERTFRLFMDNMPGMAYIKDRESRYVFCNSFLKQRIKPQGFEDIVGLTDNEIYNPEIATQITSNDNEVLSTGQVSKFIEEIPGPAETEQWLANRFPINHDDDSDLLGCVAIDISNLVKTQRELEAKERQLEAQAGHLEQANTALKVLLDHREKEKSQMEKTMMTTLEKLVVPYLQEALTAGSTEDVTTYIDIALSNIKAIAAPFASRMFSLKTKLSPAEMKVADLLRHGKTTDEIADLLLISPYTVARHRESIRRKLGLINKKVNLKSYLQALA